MRVEVSPGFALNVELAGSGPPLVLLHGFTGSARSWGRFGELLAERFTTLAIDVVGHGQSDAPTELVHYGMATAAGDVSTVIERLGFARANWLGYSMGGRLALHVATAHPDRVERLALVGASAGLRTQAERDARVASDAKLVEMIESEGIEAFTDYWESIPLFASQRGLPAEVRASIRAGRLRNSPVGLANSLRGMGTGAQQALHDLLPILPMPVLALAGALDAKYTEIAIEMADAIPSARSVIIPEAGHAAQIEQPERCAATIIEFLSNPTTTAGVTP